MDGCILDEKKMYRLIVVVKVIDYKDDRMLKNL